MSVLASIKIANLALLGAKPIISDNKNRDVKTKRNKLLQYKQKRDCINYFIKYLRVKEITILTGNDYPDINYTNDIHLQYISKNLHEIDPSIYLSALRAEGLEIASINGNTFIIQAFTNWPSDKKLIHKYIDIFKKIHDNYQELI